MSMKNIDHTRRELTMVIQRMEKLQRNIDAPYACCQAIAPAQPKAGIRTPVPFEKNQSIS